MATTTSGVHSEPAWERKEERLAASYEEEVGVASPSR
jgi:hypothetical protein